VREREILDLVARAWSNQQIAAQLGLSIKTVSNRVSSVFTKIQVVDRAHAIVKAREAETVSLEDARDVCLCRRFADHERLFAAHSARRELRVG
jgi:DNA-binding CsgD family transcriptional regulator